jgi:amino acid transporter
MNSHERTVAATMKTRNAPPGASTGSTGGGGATPSAPAGRGQRLIGTYKGQERTLRGDRLRTFGLVLTLIAASSPLTSMGGGAPVTWATTNIIGQPAVYVALALVLGLFSIGYAEMSRHVHNAGGFYAYIARGLGGTAGTSASIVALVSYNVMQTSIYGLFGATVSGFLSAHTPIKNMHWWIPALVCIAVIALLGALKIDLNAKVLGIMLGIECLIIAIMDVAFISKPGPQGVSFKAFDPSTVTGAGVGACFCFVVAAFMGFESAPVYAEETHRPQRSIGRATFWAVGLIGGFYAISAWAISVATGPDNVVAAAGASLQNNGNLLLDLGADRINVLFSEIGNVFLITSLFAALLSFHNAVARYFFAMGRERLLPQSLGRTSTASGAPALGSMLQTVVALVIVGSFAALKKDPVLQLFTWGSNVGALGVLLMMAATSVSVIVFFVKRKAAKALLPRLVVAGVAAVLLTWIFVLAVLKFSVLIGSDNNSKLNWALPGVIIAAAVVGLVYGLILKFTKPEIHSRIGLGNEAFQLDSRAAASAGDGAR